MNMSLSEIKDKAIKAIIRPPRRHYEIADLPLRITSNDMHFVRHPINFRNASKERVVGSLYFMEGIDPMGNIPCVIYLHGNASSQLEGQFLVPNLCPLGIAVYCFDFAGCGESTGEYISLGYYETRDVQQILSNLSSSYRFSQYVLWGRSMGAATAILVNHPQLVGRVVDSTYTSIQDVSYAIASSMGVPGLVISPAIWYLKNCISDVANFDIKDVVPLEAAKTGMNVPMIMGHATDDEFVPFDQGQKVFDAYNGDQKEFVCLSGGHNGRRNADWITRGCKHCLKVFGIPTKDYVYRIFTGFNDSENDPHYKSFLDMINSKAAPNQMQMKQSRPREEGKEKNDEDLKSDEQSDDTKAELDKLQQNYNNNNSDESDSDATQDAECESKQEVAEQPEISPQPAEVNDLIDFGSTQEVPQQQEITPQPIEVNDLI